SKYSYDYSFINQDAIGEIRYTWEINRLQFLPYLANYYLRNKEIKYLNLIKCHFYDWVKCNPFLKGVNWSSPMEIAIRAYQWLVVVRILIDIEDKEFLKDLIKSTIISINHVLKHLSLYSSANNHLILESAIASIIGYCLEPIYKQNWYSRGKKILKKHLPLQVHNDGVNKEQATHYHAFVLDIMLQYNFYMKKNKLTPVHEDVLYKKSFFLGNLALGGDIVEIGDSDDAKILSLSNEPNYYMYLLQLSSLYYKINFLQNESKVLKSLDAKAIAGPLCEDINKDYQYKSLNIFNEGGYIICNYANNYFLFDCGPLGFGSLAAHGHADALSIIFNHNKRPILVDPGTYIYNIEQKWRNYFRSTSSHNTLTYEDKNQSIINGSFLWGKKAEAKLIDYGENERLIYAFGSHNGYSPYEHKRSISYIKDTKILIIADYFDAKACINFTFDPNVDLKIVDAKTMCIDNELYLYSSAPYKIVEKMVSKGFLQKQITKGIVINNDFGDQAVLYTLISNKKIHICDGVVYENGVGKMEFIDYKTIRGI
ncbi:alginate lyase family protein, partial [Peribacillus frigoritolerans]|uniref:alginate lyase family protein n=1 Tax=Peribacillus frigoritolerans TaxID=450367 RepID=UPI00362D1CE9